MIYSNTRRILIVIFEENEENGYDNLLLWSVFDVIQPPYRLYFHSSPSFWWNGLHALCILYTYGRVGMLKTICCNF
jgi:hypothetical protein